MSCAASKVCLRATSSSGLIILLMSCRCKSACVPLRCARLPAVLLWAGRQSWPVAPSYLHKAGLADGDTCTPGLTLLFEDAAFAKLAPNSAQVKRARTRQQQLMRSHSAELAGIDFAVGSGDFKPFLAAFVQHKVYTLREELEAKAVQYAHLQALMPALAERSTEQAKILRAVQRVVSVMDTKAIALRDWLMGNFVDAPLLPASFAQLRAKCPTWDLKSFHRGVFPWRTDQGAVHGT